MNQIPLPFAAHLPPTVYGRWPKRLSPPGTPAQPQERQAPRGRKRRGFRPVIYHGGIPGTGRGNRGARR